MRILHCTVALLLAAPGILTAQVATPSGGKATDFQVFYRGTPIGSEQVAVTRDANGTTIIGSARIGAPVGLTVRRVEIRYTADGKPLSCSLEGSTQDRLLAINTTVDGRVAHTDITQGSDTQRKADQVAPDAVLLLNGFYGSYEALAARLASMKAGEELLAYVAPLGQLPVKVRGVAGERLRTAAGVIDAKRVGVQLVNPGGTVEAEIWLTGDGRMLRLSVPAQGFELVRNDIASVATRREVAGRPNDEQVRIQANGFSLAGTLSRPAAGPGGPGGAAPAAGKAAVRLPAVLLAASAGSPDRDETTGGIPVFAQVASALADAGYVVLRYDRRGVGQSGGREESATLSDYADDARAAVRFLRKRKDVDPNRVAVVGYGEGGMVGVLAASQDGDIRALALLAAPGVTGAELVLDQQRRALDAANVTEEARRAKTALQEKIHKAVLTGQGWDGIPPEYRRQADTPWFRSFLEFDPAAVARKLDQPVLVVHGDLDTQVVPANADKLAAALESRKPGKSRTQRVAHVRGVNHLLVSAKTGAVAEYADLAGETVSAAVTLPVIEWLKQSLTERR